MGAQINMYSTTGRNLRPALRRGAIMPLVALLLPVMMIFASLIINLSYMELSRTELRISSDAATRAAGHKYIYTQDEALARAAAREAGLRNKVTGKPLQYADSDIVVGTSIRTSLANRYTFTPGGANPNSVKITSARTAGSLSGPVGMIFPTFGAINKFEPVQSGISSQVELDVALVLDRSGSMAYGDSENSDARASKGLGPAIAPPGWWFGDPAPVGSRWYDLVDAVKAFTDILAKSPQDEHLSLVTYNTGAKKDVNLTDNYALIPKALDVYTKSLKSGGTNIRSGINAGITTLASPTLSRPWAAKVVIVLTDGRHNTGAGPEAAATKAFKNGVTVYTVTFSADADQKRMKKVSKNGGGKHFHAANKAALKASFTDIARSLPTLLTQ